jgi:hypothetical protein
MVKWTSNSRRAARCEKVKSGGSSRKPADGTQNFDSSSSPLICSDAIFLVSTFLRREIGFPTETQARVKQPNSAEKKKSEILHKHVVMTKSSTAAE